MFRKLTMIALAVLLAACSDGTAAKVDITGTYTLRTFNGIAVPTGTQVDSTFTEIVSGSITLKEDDTFSASFVDRFTTDGEVTTETTPEVGTYTFSGTTIVLTATGGHPTAGTVVDGTMTLAGEDGSYMFKK
jgi:hypothetical protein